jgi:26S proteasome regulatory subunit T3
MIDVHSDIFSNKLLFGENENKFLKLSRKYFMNDLLDLQKKITIIQEEIKQFQTVPLLIGKLIEKIDNEYAVVSSIIGNNYLVRIISTIDKEKLKINSSVMLHRKSNALINILNEEIESSIDIIPVSKKPEIKYAEIGGMEKQKEELREAVEIPLLNKKLFSRIGIEPPKGVLLHGPPGTGKTMIVKAVAFRTTASFLKAVGSEFVQKYLGEGPRMVRDLFKIAKKNSPSIMFIDEIDSIATKRFDAQTGADREVQRILMELLNQMDGFEQTDGLKIILCTNRIDTLDPALLRPGRVDRKIEFGLPGIKEKRFIFTTMTSKMNLGEDVNLEFFINRPEKISGAIICAICQEAGIQAIRKNRYIIIQKDFDLAYRLNISTNFIIFNP